MNSRSLAFKVAMSHALSTMHHEPVSSRDGQHPRAIRCVCSGRSTADISYHDRQSWPMSIPQAACAYPLAAAHSCHSVRSGAARQVGSGAVNTGSNARNEQRTPMPRDSGKKRRVPPRLVDHLEIADALTHDEEPQYA
eukprot:scaffold308789_cov27-Tisochrysis_lutea.AAC.3